MVKRSPARTDFLANILVTIVEGGSEYWADFREYEWTDGAYYMMLGASVQMLDREEPESGWKDISLDTIALGLGAIKRSPEKVAASKGILEANRENEAGNIDSNLADDIIQMALFGELVYG